MSKIPDQILWSKSQDADSYEFKIGTNSDCSDSVQNFNSLKSESVNINKLPDGQYFACLEAVDLATNKTTALNSGFKFIIDQTAPTPFNINRPFSISKILNPLFQWSASSADAVYDLYIASDAACSNIISQEKGLSTTKYRFANNFQDMSEYFVCVFARDIANNSTPASNNGYRFTINTSAIVVSFEPNTIPRDPSNVSQMHVDVIGAGIDNYRYKIASLTSSAGAVAWYE